MSATSPPGAPQAEHLTYEELEAYVDGKMSDADRGIARAHLEFCPSCSEDVRDLNTFKGDLANSKGQRGKSSWAAFVALWLTPRRAALTLGMAAFVVLAVKVARWQSALPRGVPSAEIANSNSTRNQTLSPINPLPPPQKSPSFKA